MRRIGITIAKLTNWRNRALAGAATALKKRERDDRDDEIARLKSKVGEITMDNELLNAKIAAKDGKRPLRGIRMAFVMLAILASALLGYSCSQQNPQAHFGSVRRTVEPSPPVVDGCGSLGGPGYRLPSGKCASWSSEQIPPAPIVSAPPVPIVSAPPTVEPSPPAASGCGSRGGPGYRLASGKCASWAGARSRHRQH